MLGNDEKSPWGGLLQGLILPRRTKPVLAFVVTRPTARTLKTHCGWRTLRVRHLAAGAGWRRCKPRPLACPFPDQHGAQRLTCELLAPNDLVEGAARSGRAVNIAWRGWERCWEFYIATQPVAALRAHFAGSSVQLRRAVLRRYWLSHACSRCNCCVAERAA